MVTGILVALLLWGLMVSISNMKRGSGTNNALALTRSVSVIIGYLAIFVAVGGLIGKVL